MAPGCLCQLRADGDSPAGWWTWWAAKDTKREMSVQPTTRSAFRNCVDEQFQEVQIRDLKMFLYNFLELRLRLRRSACPTRGDKLIRTSRLQTDATTNGDKVDEHDVYI